MSGSEQRGGSGGGSGGGGGGALSKPFLRPLAGTQRRRAENQTTTPLHWFGAPSDADDPGGAVAVQGGGRA